MEDYILKVKSYRNDGEIGFGTGVAIASNLVITPSHVVIGEKHTIIICENEFEVSIISDNDLFSILKVNDNDKVLTYATAFSDDEILDDDSKWYINGYISEAQKPHEVTGKGMHFSTVRSGIENWNCILQNIISGSKTNYSGLSGSPVFSQNRIVGILQCQEITDGAKTELKMASVSMFKDLLAPDVIATNEYIYKLFKKVNEYTKQQINKNKQIKKYIPDIYVEEQYYKEMVRYFADPALFVQKALYELLRYDWSVINAELLRKKLPVIDFRSYEKITKSISFYDDIKGLCHSLEEAIAIIEKAEKTVKKYSI